LICFSGKVTDTPAIADAKVEIVTPKPIEVQALQIPEAKMAIDYNQAWEVLNAESSWKASSEKQAVLADEFGITSAEHLAHVDANDIQELASKLKKVPARQLTSCFNLHK
jgi:hypothetical protein